jgi:hypothetical protein
MRRNSGGTPCRISLSGLGSSRITADSKAACDRLKCSVAGEHLVQYGTEREDVASCVEGVSFRLLGRHVEESADNRAGRRKQGDGFVVRCGGWRHQFSEAEVKHFEEATLVNNDVAGFEITVNEPALCA